MQYIDTVYLNLNHFTKIPQLLWQNPNLPKSFSNLSANDLGKILNVFTKALGKSTNGQAHNITVSPIILDGTPCMKVDFDEINTHSVSYVFMKNNNLISFDYIYNHKDVDKANPLITHSVNSIKL